MKLNDYLDETGGRPGQSRCFTCRLPKELLDQVNEARTAQPKVSYHHISAWLTSEGHPVNPATLVNHERFGHIPSGNLEETGK